MIFPTKICQEKTWFLFDFQIERKTLTETFNPPRRKTVF